MKGTIINYSDDAMSMRGNVNFQFDRSEDASVPAGFKSDRALTYDPSAYDEIAL